jgi:pectate lyase
MGVWCAAGRRNFYGKELVPTGINQQTATRTPTTIIRRKRKKMKTSNWKRVFVLCLAGFLSTMMVDVPKTWAADNPTAIRFIVNHADCSSGTSSTFEFFVSGASVGVYSSTQDCSCNSDPLVVTLNDPPTLSLIGPVGCTLVSMTLTDPAQGLALGYVRVEIDRTESGTETFCLVDYKTGGNCGNRDLCDGYQLPGTSSYSNLANCPDSLEVTPADGLSSSGYEGGPFTPAGKNYTLTNTGPNSLDWTVEANVPWLNVAPGSGTLEPNQSVVVTVSINADANSLAIGNYYIGIRFTNLTSGVIRVRPVTLSVNKISIDGFGSSATGGEGGPTVTVTNAIDFQNYIWNWWNNPLIIQVSGTLNLADIGWNGYAGISSNKTIRGIDANSTIIGNLFFFDGASNVIIEGLNITNPSGTSEGDGISVKASPPVTNIFITHCTFYDCRDGCLDITEQSDYVTVSWCKFYYVSQSSHRYVNLIGADDGDTDDRGKLHVTFHHNWWSDRCFERMPRVRFGKVHVYNNYYGCTGNSYCIGVGKESQIRLENNYFDHVNGAWINPAATPGMIGWNTGNVFVSTIIPDWASNEYDTYIFTPSYSYTLDAGEDVKSLVMAGAGAYPDGDITPPSPDPMTFATAPYAASYTSISMVATTATDGNGNGVEYYFICMGGGGHSSSWQAGTTYTDTGLLPSTTYTYTVKARDKSDCKNETATSTAASATTLADTTAPTPNPMTFATAPYATSLTSIDMVATTAADISGVEYYFACTAGGGHDSGWQTGTSYTDTGLMPSITYTYTVKARDLSPAQNETAASSPASATTQDDTTAPTPNPTTWAHTPYGTDLHSLSMIATTATDISGVEYLFTCTSGGGHSSTWQDSTTYTDTGLSEDSTYTYTVTARDKSYNHNATTPSDPAIGTTPLDTMTPTPNQMTFDVAPYALGLDSIAMTATMATDISGVEYFFANITDPNHDSGWQDDTAYTDTELTDNTTYSYCVIARDKSLGQNETAWSNEANAMAVQYTCSGTIGSDLDNNCKVDFRDYALMASYWNEVLLLNYNVAVNSTFDTDIVPGWQIFDLPLAVGTLLAEYDGGNGNPFGSVVMGNEQDTTGTSGHYFYQAIRVKSGRQYKLSAEWTGDISGSVSSDPCHLGNWAEVLVIFETNADANTWWTAWTDPNAVMYGKAFGVVTQNIDSSGTWPTWEPITASQTNGPADGVFTASGDYMVVAFSEGGLPGSGFGYFFADNVKVEGTCATIDLNGDCNLDWLDILDFAEEWLTCNRNPPSECGQ